MHTLDRNPGDNLIESIKTAVHVPCQVMVYGLESRNGLANAKMLVEFADLRNAPRPGRQLLPDGIGGVLPAADGLFASEKNNLAAGSSFMNCH